MASLPAPIKLTPAQIASNNAMTQSGNYTFANGLTVSNTPSNTSGTFQGGQSMPAYGTSAYNNLISGTTLPTTINSANTSPSTEIKLPNTPVVQNQMGNIIGGNVGLGISIDPKTGMPTTIQNKTPEQLSADNLTSLLGLTPKPQNLSDIYSNLETESGIQNARQNVNNITARINAITAQAQADQLSLTGQGRGVPEVIIGGQQAQVSKEAAIKILPLQAELAAAQNNLQLAQDRLDTLFKIRSQDVQNEYEYKKMQYEAISNIVTKSEQRAYDALKLNNDRTYQEKQNNIERMDSYSKLALSSGQPQLISKINSLNPSSPTFNNDLALAVSTLKSTAKTEVVDVNGSKVLINSMTGETIKNLSTTPNTVNSPENRLLTEAFNSAVTGLPGTQLPQAKATFNSLINSGDTQGAKEYLLRVAVSSAPTDQQNQIVGRMQAIDSLKEIDSLLSQAKSKGANTNIVTGNIVNIAQKLGTSTNQDLSYIGSRIQQVLQTYRRSMTGVAFSPSESKEYAKIFPDITNVDSLNTTKISALTDSLNSNNKTALSFYIGGTNYDKIFGKDSKLNTGVVSNTPVTEGSLSSGVTFKVVK